MVGKTKRYIVVLLAVTFIASLLLGSMTATAAGVVSDPVLKKIIQLKLGLPASADITAADVAKITSLAYSGYAASVHGKINSLAGLQYATKMTLLDVTDCNVSSLAPIANLKSLRMLVLRNNPVDLRTGSVDYAIVMALKARGCKVVYNTPKPSPYLIGLKVSVGTLIPKYVAGVFSFKLVLPDTNAGRAVTITPTKADAAAKMTINGYSVGSGKVYINVGSTKTVTIKVTSKDKSSTKTYKVTITRPSTNNKLSTIKKSTGTLTPLFNSGKSSYVLALKSSVSKVTITPVRADRRSKILIDGKAASSKVVTVAKGASKTIKITVVAQSGAQRNYYVTVCRAK